MTNCDGSGWIVTESPRRCPGCPVCARRRFKTGYGADAGREVSGDPAIPIGLFGSGERIEKLTARAEKAERERDELRLALGRLRAGKPESGEANPDE